MNRLDKTCKDSKTATPEMQFLKYHGPCTQTQIAKYRMTTL